MKSRIAITLSLRYTFPVMAKEIPLYQQAIKYLKNEINKMTPGKNKFDSEPILTKKLPMSRETIRKAFTELSKEGLISKWHGKGNWGHPSVLKLTMRFDIDSNFRQLLQKAGYSVKSTRSLWESCFGDKDMSKRIPLAEKTKFIHFVQYIFADNLLAIMGDVFINTSHIEVFPEEGEYQENINSFFKTHCKMKSEYVVAWPKAEIKSEIAEAFSLPGQTPLLCWEEAYYNIYDENMGFIKVYFNPEIMDLSMLLHFS